MTTPSSSYGPTGPTSIRPQQRSRKTVWIIVGSVLAVVLVCCCGGGGTLFATWSTDFVGVAEGTIDSYCTQLSRQQFTSAYGLLSTHAKSQISQDKFVSEAQAVDGNPIPVTGYSTTESLLCDSLTYTSTLMTDAGYTLSVGLNVANPQATGCFGQVNLVKELWSWKIDSYSGFPGCFPDLTPDAGGNSGG